MIWNRQSTAFFSTKPQCFSKLSKSAKCQSSNGAIVFWFFLNHLQKVRLMCYLYPKTVWQHVDNRTSKLQCYCCCSYICRYASERATIWGRVSETCRSCISYLQNIDYQICNYKFHSQPYKWIRNWITIALLTFAAQKPCRNPH